MERALRFEIIGEVKRAMAEALREQHEVWLTGDELGKQFGFFTKSWLKTYGQLLPRERVTVNTEDGPHSTGWCYPLHQIQSMIKEGKLRTLVYLKGKGSTRKYEEAFG